MAIPQHLLDRIRNDSELVSVVSEYINLKKTGRNYKAICPFHKEKTPSFVVSPDKQIYHCFGCGEGGNVFNFLMKAENISFFEAARKLARRAGIPLPADFREDAAQEKISREREELFAVNRAAAEYYHAYLKKQSPGHEAHVYLGKRKVSSGIIDLFRLGYAPAPGRDMYAGGGEKRYSSSQLEKAGLVVFSERRNSYVDRLGERIIFPIADAQSRVIGFGGRTIREGPPKYLNSPETPLFHKSRVLYGIDIAKKSIRANDRMIIVEGYMDVLTAHMYGFDNVVATLGTSLTEHHTGVIRQYTDKVIIIYDADAAGVNASLRGLDLLVENGLKVRVALLARGSDPDTFLKENGREKFKEVIGNALPLVDYRIRIAAERADLKTVEGKVFVAEQVMPTIARIRNLIEQKEQVKKLADFISVSEQTLFSELKKESEKESALKKTIARSMENTSVNRAVTELERQLVHFVLNYPDQVGVLKKDLSPGDFTDSDLSEILGIIYELDREGKEVRPATIMSHHGEQDQYWERLNRLVASLALDDRRYERPARIAVQLINDIKKSRMKEQKRNLQRQYIEQYLDNRMKKEDVERYKETIRQTKGSKDT